jgi:UDP-glucose 4-epimerase
MNRKDSILLTGGLGFIGSHTFVELFENKKNYDIIIVDNLSNSKYDQLEKLEKMLDIKIKLYIIDMCDLFSLRRVFFENNITHVIHLAGLKSVNESISNSLFYYTHNLQILINLLNTMKLYKCKNIVFSSSATVYGNNNHDICRENLQTGINMTNPYGKTKYFQEEILIDLYKSDPSWNITILRYFNPVGNHPSAIIGEEPNGVPANLFPCIMQSIKNNTQLKIFGNTYNTHDGTCIRDFIHVVDLGNAHVKALDCIGLNIYNVGTGKKTSVLDIITTFEKVNNIKINYIIADKRDGDVECVCADCSKIKKELGWSAKKTVEDMCKDSYKFLTK